MLNTHAADSKQASAQGRSAAHDKGGKGLSMPSVPVLQHAAEEPGQLPAAGSKPIQRKRAGESAAAQPMSRQDPVQRKVKNTIPNNTRIVIENPAAGDLGDTGTIIRNSQVPGYKAVRFDNEPHVLYRVHLDEMSPVSPEDKEAHGDGTTSASIRLAAPVTITAEVDLSDDSFQTADFFAYNGAHKIGKLMMNNSKQAGFIITDVYTNLAPAHSVPGLGVLFLNIAARVAKSLNQPTMLLAANRQNMKEKHPAPFYNKFGFEGKDLAAAASDAEKIGKSLEDYMASYKAAIEMRGGTAKVAHETGEYMRGKGW